MSCIIYLLTLAIQNICPPHAFANSKNISPIGPESWLGGSARNISANGRAVVGTAQQAGGYDTAFKIFDGHLTIVNGIGGNISRLYATSADGRISVGEAETIDGKLHAFIHTDAGGSIDLGTLGGAWSTARAISADGSTIVGGSSLITGETIAFKHTMATGMLSLGTLGGSNSMAYGLSSNGDIAVGWSTTLNGHKHAFKHSDLAGMTDLGTLGGNESYAFGISADGRAIVGAAQTLSGSMNAFKHTDSSGLVSLGTLGGENSIAYGISADGSVIVGAAQLTNNHTHAFWFSEEKGMVDIGTLGGLNSEAHGISSDGTIVVGNSQDSKGVYRPFIWRFSPHTSGNIVDIERTYRSIQNVAQSNFALLDIKNYEINSLLEQECDSIVDNSCIEGGVETIRSGSFTSDLTNVTFGYRITENVRAGLTIATPTSTDSNEITSRHFGLPGLGAYLALDTPQLSENWSFRVAAAMANEKVRLIRPSLENTERGRGESDLDSWAALMQTAYAVRYTDLTVRPHTRLKFSSSTRKSYSEADEIAFPFHYDQLQVKRLEATIGTAVTYDLSSNIRAGGDISMTTPLWHKYKGFIASTDALGSIKIPDSHQSNQVGYSTWISFGNTDDTTFALGGRWGEQPFGNQAYSLFLEASIQF